MTALTDDTLPITPRAMRDEMIVFTIMTALLALVPFSGIYPFFVMQALCFALVACAFNLLIGYGGLLSFGHAMFLGTAGYCSGHALKVWGLPPELGIVVGTAAAALLAVVSGYVSIRRQGIYFSMITLALSQLLYFIYLQAPFTHGEDGIQGIPQGHLFGFLDLSRPTVLYYVVLAGFLGGFLLIYRTINSPFGEVLKSIRENEQRAISPTTPRRNVKTHATKITPWITVTHWPKPARYCCMAMMTNAPTTGPNTVPSPPTSVISTISPDMLQCTSVSEAFCATNTFSAPANPAIVPDRMKASSLYWSVL